MKYELKRINFIKDKRYYVVQAPEGYPGIKIAGLYTTEHRAVYWLHHGELPPDGWHIHHINGDSFDNDTENLEALPASEHVKEKGHIADLEPAPYLTLTCFQCKKEFKKLESSHRYWSSLNQEHFFCNKSCQVTYQNQFKKDSKNNYPINRKKPTNSGVELICKACGEMYKVRPSYALTSKTCSLPCSYVYKSITRTGVKVPERANKIQYLTLECDYCHKEFTRQAIEVTKSIKAGSVNKFCSSKCTVIFGNQIRFGKCLQQTDC